MLKNFNSSYNVKHDVDLQHLCFAQDLAVNVLVIFPRVYPVGVHLVQVISS